MAVRYRRRPSVCFGGTTIARASALHKEVGYRAKMLARSLFRLSLTTQRSKQLSSSPVQVRHIYMHAERARAPRPAVAPQVPIVALGSPATALTVNSPRRRPRHVLPPIPTQLFRRHLRETRMALSTARGGGYSGMLSDLPLLTLHLSGGTTNFGLFKDADVEHTACEGDGSSVNARGV